MGAAAEGVLSDDLLGSYLHIGPVPPGIWMGEGAAGSSLDAASLLPELLSSSFPRMPYLAVSCIFASILSFAMGPEEWS